MTAAANIAQRRKLSDVRCYCGGIPKLVDASGKYPGHTVFLVRCECLIEGPQAANDQDALNKFERMVEAIPQAIAEINQRHAVEILQRKPAPRGRRCDHCGFLKEFEVCAICGDGQIQ